MKRVAVIGYGGQGAWHCRQIEKSDVACLAGTYDIREVRRDAAKRDGVPVYESNEAIFHDETVCLLSKLQNRQHIEIELNMDELDVTNAEKKATYEEIKVYVHENTGLKVSNLYIAQVKQKYGIIERENYNKSKSEDSRQPQCPKEKEDAIREALEHFGMI